MGLLKSIWDGFGDLYDSLENSSNNNYNEDNSYNNYNEHYEDDDCYERRQVRSGPQKVHVMWNGYYRPVSGGMIYGEWEGYIPVDMYERLSKDGKATTQFLKRVIYDSEEFQSQSNHLRIIYD